MTPRIVPATPSRTARAFATIASLVALPAAAEAPRLGPHDAVSAAGVRPLVVALPEPTTIALLAIALLAIVVILRVTRHRNRRQGRRPQRTLPPA